MFRLASMILSAGLGCLVLLLGVGFFAFGGAPKKYEVDAVGVAYAGVLNTIEESARELHRDYCAGVDDSARRAANCSAASTTDLEDVRPFV